MIEFLEDIIYELKDIPGLGFLKGIREGIATKRLRMKKKLHELNVRKNSIARGARSISGQSSKGSKRRDE